MPQSAASNLAEKRYEVFIRRRALKAQSQELPNIGYSDSFQNATSIKVKWQHGRSKT
jgi:hypothetical protein